MRICYFGIYGRTHPRNTTVIESLRRAGHEVHEIHEAPRRGIGKYLRLLRRLRANRHDFDAVIVGFPGQQAVIVARLAYGGPIIFNALLSLYDAVVHDYRQLSRLDPRAWYLWLADAIAARLADVTVLDCEAYIDYWVAAYRLPRERLIRIFQTANEDMLSPISLPEAKHEVHYYGSFHPSHGSDTIVRAAALLGADGIRFVLSGKGPCRARDEALAQALGASNVSFVPPLPGAAALNEFIRSSWVSLGLFSKNQKADRAIGTKVLEALWCGRPVVAAATRGTRELLVDGVSALLVPPEDPEALAGALRRLKADDALRMRIGRAGKEVYGARASLAETGREFEHAITLARARRGA